MKFHTVRRNPDGSKARIVIREVCILDCDSPSYPPTDEERLQCLCKLCIKDLERKGALLGHYGRPENTEEDDDA